MSIRKLKPSQYIEEFYPGGGITTQAVRNWIRKGKLKAERTPGDHFLILVEDNKPVNNVTKLVSFLES
ncbi:hypothetical protein [Rheinheimera sp. MMS21-TC3]|uniref:hypothetical protein n=1 Tax=Rheinheimera sp. MMS21-TC3 TaxID=3072790 RepID=UPI0028C455F1|nr:hypothetical protein [Rheinheimera sp. MMS21-TC3]WNO60846.1 hypothetical protein RDV63_07755 [Rheinheimera sp. MMS21-TC3]